MKLKVVSCVIFLCAAIASFRLLMSFAEGYRSSQYALIASSIVFVVSALIVFRWPRASHWLGLVIGLGGLYWFFRLEFGYLFPALNAWIVFNLPDSTPDFSHDVAIAKLKIIFAVVVVIATISSGIRLLPARWSLRNRPVRDRLWPALAVSVLFLCSWYILSVRPYRIPLIADGASPELSLLHIEKNGNQFHETGIHVLRDGRVYLFRNDRRLFHFRFSVRFGSVVLPPDNTTRKAAFALAAEFANNGNVAAQPLRSHKAEGWYVRTEQGHISAFTTEDGIPPPKSLLTAFRTLEDVVPLTNKVRDTKDVCFGFCYDPLAGLGVVYMNDRCTERNGTICK